LIFKKYINNNWSLITPVVGNFCLLSMLITHTIFIKQGLIFFELYSLKNYLITQILLETIVIISIVAFYNKFINQKINKYVSFYLLHFPLLYVMYIAFFYLYDPDGCLMLLFKLYENKLFFILRVIITIISTIYFVRLSKKLNTQMLKFHFLIFSLIILFTLL